MSRHRPSASYNHRCVALNHPDDFEISWTVDRFVKGSRLRFPRRTKRLTGPTGARLFCERWGIPFPLREGA